MLMTPPTATQTVPTITDITAAMMFVSVKYARALSGVMPPSGITMAVVAAHASTCASARRPAY